MDKNTKSADSLSLGGFLKGLREGKKLSLRDVETATENEISNAYLSQIENGKIIKPSPDILYTLSEIYGCSYDSLMERAGYVSSMNARKDDEKHGRAATFAVQDLTREEEDALLEYLTFIRTRKGKP